MEKKGREIANIYLIIFYFLLNELIEVNILSLLSMLFQTP